MDDDGYYSMKQVTSRFNCSRTCIDRWIADPKVAFPPRVYFGPQEPTSCKSRYGGTHVRRSTCRFGFPKKEVHAWEKSRPRQKPTDVFPDQEDDE